MSSSEIVHITCDVYVNGGLPVICDESIIADSDDVHSTWATHSYTCVNCAEVLHINGDICPLHLEQYNCVTCHCGWCMSGKSYELQGTSQRMW